MNITSLIAANYNFIKGQLGEAIVERLFDSLDMHVCRYGYEVVTPTITLLNKQGQVSRKAIKRISNHPDFIVINTKEEDPSAQLFKIEVKYGTKGSSEFIKFQNYDQDVCFVFMDDQNFWIASKIELDIIQQQTGLKSFLFKKLSPLESYKPFNLTETQVRTVMAFKSFLNATFARLSKQNDIIKSIERDYQDVWEGLEKVEAVQPSEDLQEFIADAETDLSSMAESKKSKGKTLPSNHGRAWNAEEAIELRNHYLTLIDNNYTDYEARKMLALKFERSIGSLRSKLFELGVYPIKE